jgi:carboxylesterase
MVLMPGAEPFSVDGDHVGVLVLHGFTSTPKSMMPWAQELAAQGWSVRLPLLPGHGTTWQDMNLTTWDDWMAEANAALRELQDRCTSVFVMGLSMGGSLSLRLAEEHGDSIAGIAVVNPAVHTERPDRFLLPILRHFVPAFPGIRNDISKPGQDEGAYDRIPLKAAHSLQQGWKLIKDDIAKVRQPLVLFRSSVDHVVEPSNAEYILAHVSSTDKEEVVLADSFHVATLDYDAEVIHRESIAFVRRLTA